MLPESRSGKMSTLAPPFSVLNGKLLQDLGVTATSACTSPSMISVGSRSVHELHRLAHLVAQRMFGAAEAGEGEHSNARLHVEAAGLSAVAQCDLHQLLGSGLDVDGGVGQELEVALAGDHRVQPATLWRPSRMPMICSAGRMVSG